MKNGIWKKIRSISSKGNEPEAIILITAFCIVFGAIAFVKFASEVREGETLAFDETVLRFLRSREDPSAGLRPPWLKQVALDLSALGSPAVLTLVTLASFVLFLIQRRIKPMMILLLGLGGGLILTLALKGFFDRSRPAVVPHLEIVTTASFPSGHALLSTIVYCTLAAISASFASNRRTKIYLIAMALLFAFCVGCSRVCLGVHYPTDVMAGWTVGILWSVICWFVSHLFFNSEQLGKRDN